MNEKHFEKFKNKSKPEPKWVGGNVFNWWLSVFNIQDTRLKPTKELCRNQLKTLCASADYSDVEAFAAVMAWGRMRRDHGRQLKTNIENVCDVVGHLRRGQYSSVDAYSKFFDLRYDKTLPGMGAAYYTKLIFFCSPKHDGYIMDQWTSKSINLIFGSEIVDVTPPGWVNDKNNSTTYNKFCRCIEKLSQRGGWSPEDTEIRLFSKGGAKKDCWRSYVIHNWSR